MKILSKCRSRNDFQNSMATHGLRTRKSRGCGGGISHTCRKLDLHLKPELMNVALLSSAFLRSCLSSTHQASFSCFSPSPSPPRPPKSERVCPLAKMEEGEKELRRQQNIFQFPFVPTSKSRQSKILSEILQEM